MTRKDYKLIAEAFALFNYLHQPTRHYIANALADRLENDNPRFDRTRFIEACVLTAACPPTSPLGMPLVADLAYRLALWCALALWLPIEPLCSVTRL
jgi:hypothetical protein